MTDPIVATTDGPIKILSINDAPINRMSLEFMDALEDEVSSIADDSRIRVVVLTAEGDSNFSVGNLRLDCLFSSSTLKSPQVTRPLFE